MKLIAKMILFLSMFNFCFAEFKINYLGEVNIGLLDKVFLEKGFKKKESNQESLAGEILEYITYSKNSQKFDQVVDIASKDGKPYSIYLISRHNHLQSDKAKRLSNLKTMLKTVENSIENKEIRTSLSQISKKLKTESFEEEYKTYELNYIVRATETSLEITSEIYEPDEEFDSEVE